MLNISLFRSPGIKHILTGIVLILALALFMAPQAMAGKPDKPCRLHGKVTCDDPGPNPNIGREPTKLNVDTMISLAGDHVDSNDPIECTPDDGFFAYAAGNYKCIVGTREIFLHSDGGASTLIFANKHSRICTALDDGITLTPNSGSLTYGWTDGCNVADDTTCAVEVRATFSDDDDTGPISVLTGGKANMLDVVMHSSVDTTYDDPADSNPFYHEREILITSVVFEFLGAKGTAALCTLNVAWDDNYLISEPNN